jgi:putative ABC transport system permease protein
MWASIDLGVRMLFHQRWRLLSMSVSVAVGVVVVFVEMGLLQGILDSQALIATLVRGELIVMNKARTDLHRWDKIDAIRLAQIAAIPGVAKVMPVYEDHVSLRDPDDNRVRRIILFAFSPNDMPLNIGNPAKVSADLKMSHSFLFDRLSRPIFGDIKPGQDIEIDKYPLRVSGLIRIGPDIVNDGNIVMSEGQWLARSPDSKPIMGVISVDPDANTDAVRTNILANLPDDIAVMTPQEAVKRENSATLKSTPIGLLFAAGMIAGIFIGTINCYQVLFTEVSDHLGQFATLKAIGFTQEFLQAVILTQAALLSGTGFAAGLILSAIADAYIASATMLPTQIHVMSASLVYLGTAVMCILAGWIAVGRLQAADPAALY